MCFMFAIFLFIHTVQETVSLVYRDIKHSTSIDSPTMPNPPPVEIAPVNNTCTDNN